MSDLLDSTITKRTVDDGVANLQDRVRHFYIDGIIVFVGSISLVMLILEPTANLSGEHETTLAVIVILVVYTVYYTLFEFFFGFTVGKFLNKTRVVSTKGTKPTFNQILIRTFSRLIPGGFLTIPTPYNAALHDLLSKTRLVRKKKKYFVDVD